MHYNTAPKACQRFRLRPDDAPAPEHGDGPSMTMADDATRNPWTTLRVSEKYANPWITVEEHDVLTPKGKPGIYGVVRPRTLAIGVLPLDADGMTTLVGQYRYPIGRYTWEMPEGGGDKTVPAIESARRELLEETGLVASSWLEILRMDLSNALSDEHAIRFLAWDLEQRAPEPEETGYYTVPFLIVPRDLKR